MSNLLPEQGKKEDAGKSRVDLIPAEVLLSVGDVLRYGAERYEEHNWTKGIPYHKLMGSALRHIYKFKAGEDLDESGLNNIDHAITNLIMLKYMFNHRKDLDTRWETNEEAGKKRS